VIGRIPGRDEIMRLPARVLQRSAPRPRERGTRPAHAYSPATETDRALIRALAKVRTRMYGFDRRCQSDLAPRASDGTLQLTDRLRRQLCRMCHTYRRQLPRSVCELAFAYDVQLAGGGRDAGASRTAGDAPA